MSRSTRTTRNSAAGTLVPAISAPPSEGSSAAMGQIADALNRASWTRQPPKSSRAQLGFLMRAAKGSTAAVAARLGVSQRTVQRYLKGDRAPAGPVAKAMAGAVASDWQPRVKARQRRAVASHGIVVSTPATFRFGAAGGSSDDGRLRRITEHIPGHMAGPIWDAYQAGDERRAQSLIGDGLGHAYFRDRGQRAHGLDVELTGIDYIDVEIEEGYED